MQDNQERAREDEEMGEEAREEVIYNDLPQLAEELLKGLQENPHVQNEDGLVDEYVDGGHHPWVPEEQWNSWGGKRFN